MHLGPASGFKKQIPAPKKHRQRNVQRINTQWKNHLVNKNRKTLQVRTATSKVSEKQANNYKFTQLRFTPDDSTHVKHCWSKQVRVVLRWENISRLMRRKYTVCIKEKTFAIPAIMRKLKDEAATLAGQDRCLLLVWNSINLPHHKR